MGGAFAISGGFISIVGIIFCAILSKISFDLLIYLSIVVNDSPSTTVNGTGIRRRRIESSSYEELGAAAFGGTGRAVVIISKAFYTFGTMVVYNIVVKDNCASAMSHLLFENDTNHPSTWWSMLIQSNNAMAVFVSAAVILPLCLLRDLKPLEKSSIFGMISIIALVMIVIYLYFTTATGDSSTRGDASTATGIHESSGLYAHWFQVRGGVLRRYIYYYCKYLFVKIIVCSQTATRTMLSLGTFIFTFIAHATVHLAYDSIHPQIRNYKTWKLVSSISLTLSTFLALIAGIFVYMTFWLDATSSMFVLYPPSAAIDISKILLTITIALTFPFLMLACREIIIVSLISLPHQQQQTEEETTELLESTHNVIRRPWLLPGRHRQLTRGYHVLVTTLIWLITLILALVAPSLGDVLNLVGCATGTGKIKVTAQKPDPILMKTHIFAMSSSSKSYLVYTACCVFVQDHWVQSSGRFYTTFWVSYGSHRNILFCRPPLGGFQV